MISFTTWEITVNETRARQECMNKPLSGPLRKEKKEKMDKWRDIDEEIWKINDFLLFFLF